MSPHRLQHLIDRIRNAVSTGTPRHVAQTRRMTASEIARLPPILRDDLGFGAESTPADVYSGSLGGRIIGATHQQN